MIRYLRKIVFFIWPPYEAYVARKYIETNILKEREAQIILKTE